MRALFLSLLDVEPAIVHSDSAFRSALWDLFERRTGDKTVRSATLAQWAALVGKEYMQDALSLIWMEFCRQGLVAQPVDGFPQPELDRFIRERLVGAGVVAMPSTRVSYEQTTLTAVFASSLDEASYGLSQEDLRQWALNMDTAISGLSVLLVLLSRLPEGSTAPRAWSEIAGQSSGHQPGLLGLRVHLTQHLAGHPTIPDTMAWLVHRYVIAAHESIAYSKLPDLTFRFRWENGRLRFYDLNDARFELVDIRRDAMTSISEDLGLWEQIGNTPQITVVGREFIAQVLL